MSLKRKDPLEESDAESSSSQASGYGGISDDEIDITNALSGKKTVAKGDSDEDFDELEKIIKHSVVTRDKKEGTKLLKQTKKKSKLTKGEVGGGSFQSMGELFGA